jgi:phosphatidate cytidylyltransferase
MALPPARPFDPSLRQRIVSSLVLGAGALAATVAGGWVFVTMVVVAVVIMAGEWSRLATEVPAPRVALVAATAAVPVLAVLALVTARSPALAAGVLVAGAATLALVSLASPTWHPLRAAGGALYVGTPALALVWLRADTPAGMRQLIWLLVVIWATDICAYLVGRSLGGPKLAPRISPGKTWSGLLGGVAGASLLGGLAAQALGAGHLLAAAVGGGLAVVGQAGDLFESALKRRAGLKDSGHLIPGHGGLLDRIDGLVFAAPVFAGLVWLGLQAEGSP